MFSTCSQFLRTINSVNKTNLLANRSKLLQPLNDSLWCNRPHARATLYFSTAEFNFTVQESLIKWSKVFEEAKILEPLESIANLLAHTLKTNKLSDVYDQRKLVLSDLQVKKLHEMCQKRLEQMPVQYIIGEWDFRGINLKLRPPVFIPRPETETLVELVKLHAQRNENKVKTILELCCGSGAISLSLLQEIPTLNAVTFDKSPEACKLCLENAKELGLSSRLAVDNKSISEFESSQRYDVIVSNPPYVPSGEMRQLQAEILLYEDLEALDGGLDGLNIVRQVLSVAGRLLNPSGRLFLEVDPSHPQLIRDELMKRKNLGLRMLTSHKDLNNDSRFVEIIKN